MSKLEYLEDYEHILPEDKVIHTSKEGCKFTAAHIKALCPSVIGVLDHDVTKDGKDLRYLPWRGGEPRARRFNSSEIAVLTKKRDIAFTIDMRIFESNKPGLSKFFESDVKNNARKDNIFRAIGLVEKFKNLPDNAPQNQCSKASLYNDLKKRKDGKITTKYIQEKYNLGTDRTSISDAVYNINYITNGKINLFTENIYKNGVFRITKELYQANPDFLEFNKRGIIIDGIRFKPCK